MPITWDELCKRIPQLAPSCQTLESLARILAAQAEREITVPALRGGWRRHRDAIVEAGGEDPGPLSDLIQPTDLGIDASWLEWAVGGQRDALQAVVDHGSIAAAAVAVGVTEDAIRGRLMRLRKKAAKRGWAPREDVIYPVPVGYEVKGTSTYYDKSGRPTQRWVKTRKSDEERWELLVEAIQELAEPFKGLAEPAPAPCDHDSDLLCVYPMGDPHLGMYAWHRETGRSFDLRLAEQNLVTAVDKLVELAPPAEQALLISLGDFFHADNQEARTWRSGNALDVDTRWAKVLGVGVRTMRRLIDRCLERHKSVRVICEIGNHDDHSAIMLAIVLANFYEREPRVEIDTSPATFHWHRFGSNLIGVTHGHNTKARDLGPIMATDRAADWGETSHRYWYTGHVHHDTMKEYPGVIVETFRTLAPADAWHHAHGYRSGQDMKVDVLHREWGRQARHIVGLRQIWK